MDRVKEKKKMKTIRRAIVDPRSGPCAAATAAASAAISFLFYTLTRHIRFEFNSWQTVNVLATMRTMLPINLDIENN